MIMAILIKTYSYSKKMMTNSHSMIKCMTMITTKYNKVNQITLSMQSSILMIINNIYINMTYQKINKSCNSMKIKTAIVKTIMLMIILMKKTMMMMTMMMIMMMKIINTIHNRVPNHPNPQIDSEKSLKTQYKGANCNRQIHHSDNISLFSLLSKKL